MRWVVRVVAALVLVAVSTPPAAADGTGIQLDVPGDARGFVGRSAEPLFEARALMPGDVSTVHLRVRNGSAHVVRLGLRATHLRARENGCLPPEVAAGDSSCGWHAGELARWLRLVVTRDDTDEVLWSRSIAQLSRRQHAGPEIDARTTLPLSVDLVFDPRADNRAMTDGVAADLVFTADGSGAHSEAEVKGVEALTPGDDAAGPGASDAASAVGLPSAGSPVTVGWLGLSLVTLLTGIWLLARSRRLEPRAAAARHRADP